MSSVVQFLEKYWPLIIGLGSAFGTAIVAFVNPKGWLRTKREQSGNNEIKLIIDNNRLMREEFAEMNREMADHRQRIRMLENIVVDKEVNEKRLMGRVDFLETRIKRKDGLIAEQMAEITHLTDLIEHCKKCEDAG